MSMIQEVSENGFKTQVIEAVIPVVVDFWASWCGPCRMMTPVLESLAAQMNGLVKVVKINTDENFSLAKEYGIMAVPTLVVFRDGREVRRLTGFLPKDELEAWMRKAVETETKAR